MRFLTEDYCKEAHRALERGEAVPPGGEEAVPSVHLLCKTDHLTITGSGHTQENSKQRRFLAARAD